MITVNNTLYRQMAREIVKHDLLDRFDTYIELTNHLNKHFNSNTANATVSAIAYAVAGTKDILGDK